MGRDGSSPEEERDVIEKLREYIVRMDGAVADGPWMVGEQFTLADIALVPTLVRMADIGLANVWDGRRRVADWFERVQARPSFAKTFIPARATARSAPIRRLKRRLADAYDLRFVMPTTNLAARFTRAVAALIVASSGLLASGAQAQSDYPSKPVRIIVPSSPGGAPTQWRVFRPRICRKGLASSSSSKTGPAPAA